MKEKFTYADGILEAYEYLLTNHPDFFIIGQGLWSPWYVGSTMKDLDKKFGKERVIDCPVSELATTGATVGAAICGYRPMIVHPRVDFMLLAVDQIVTQAAKWRHMFGGNSSAPATFRAIINRGGEQGAQHSQSLHSWFAHIPGLKVVMPYTAKDARDLMISSVLADDPVMFIDDRWLYEKEEKYQPIEILDLNDIGPQKLQNGTNVTLIGISYTSLLCEKAAQILLNENISCDVFDIRVLNPLKTEDLIESVKKTGRLVVVDGDWASCGMASEIITSILEQIDVSLLKKSPVRITLPNAPAPTSKVLEDCYYIKENDLVNAIKQIVN
ncbi:MAG: transketolase C-terminal domain-containing protein [Sediminibacterium sp.]